jgi:hypothetical protein
MASAEAIELGQPSLSVGSTIRVPATGNDMVGAWKPKVDEALGDILGGDGRWPR